MAAAEVAAEQAVIAENTKQDAALATASAITNTLTSLLGDSKGAQIAGLVAQNAFEAASVLVSGTRASAAATAAANGCCCAYIWCITCCITRSVSCHYGIYYCRFDRCWSSYCYWYCWNLSITR